MSAFTSYFILLYFYLSRKLNARLLLVAEYFYTVVLDLTILHPVALPLFPPVGNRTSTPAGGGNAPINRPNKQGRSGGQR